MWIRWRLATANSPNVGARRQRSVKDQFERDCEGPNADHRRGSWSAFNGTRDEETLAVNRATDEHQRGLGRDVSPRQERSITALVGGRLRVIREAHRESVARCTSRAGGVHDISAASVAIAGRKRTANAVTALFEHDSARPVNGYAAPAAPHPRVIFNLTETAPTDSASTAGARAVPVAAVRHGRLSIRAAARTDRQLVTDRAQVAAANQDPRLPTREYLDASSPRRQQIEDYLAEADDRAPRGADRGSLTREAKLDVSPR